MDEVNALVPHRQLVLVCISIRNVWRDGEKKDWPLTPTDGKYRRICTSWMLPLYLKNLQSSLPLRPDPECDPSEEDIESADGSPVAAEECPTSRDTHVCRPCLRFSSFTTLTSVALGLIAPLSFLWTTAAWDTTNQPTGLRRPAFKRTNMDQLCCRGVRLFNQIL